MKQYWPNAYAYTKDGPEFLFTYDPATSFEKAERQFEIWQDHYHYELAARWIETKTETRTEDSARRVNMDLVKRLWSDLADVPVVNPEGNYQPFIETGWGCHKAGTAVEDIWKWFEWAFNVSVVKDLMKGE